MNKQVEIVLNSYIDEICYSEEQLIDYVEEKLEDIVGFHVMIESDWSNDEVKLIFHSDNFDDLTTEQLGKCKELGLSFDDEKNTESLKNVLNISFNF